MSDSSTPHASHLEHAFTAACGAVFDSLLLSYGFARGATRLDPAFCDRYYCAGARYIVISVSADSREPPVYANVVLGEGSVEWPERDWNSIALWRLVRDGGAGDEVSAGTYPLSESSTTQSTPADLRPLLTKMRDDLVSFGAEFLSADLRAFRRSRAAQTRTRSPYMIHRPDGEGGYASSVDLASAKLRERFSREEGA